MSDKPRLFLHIGTHKTGTTSIQRFCTANRDELAEVGLLYPALGLGGYPAHYAHHRLAHATAGRDDVMEIEHVTHFLDLVRSEVRPGQSVLISAEPYYRHRIRNANGNQSVREYVELVGQLYEGFAVTVLVMLRRQDLLLEAFYAEHVMATPYTEDIATFHRSRQRLLDYRRRLANWADVFGAANIWIRPFEPSLMDHPVEREFLEWMGIEWSDDFAIGRRHNETPSRTFVEFKRMMNDPLQQSAAANTTLRQWVENLERERIPGIPDLGKYYLNPEQRLALMARYEEDNKAVAATYLGTEQLFRLPVQLDVERYTGDLQLSDADGLELARRLVQLALHSA